MKSIIDLQADLSQAAQAIDEIISNLKEVYGTNRFYLSLEENNIRDGWEQWAKLEVKINNDSKYQYYQKQHKEVVDETTN